MSELVLIDNLADLHEIEQEWHEIGYMFSTPFLQYDWFLSCAEHFYKPSQIRVAVLSENKHISAIAPLAIVKRQNVNWLETIGCSYLYEPTGFLYENANALNTIIESLSQKGYPLDFGRIPAKHPLLKTKSLSADQNGLWILKTTANNCKLYLKEGWDKIWSGMSKSRKTDFRRLKRRAKALGGFHLEAISPSQDEFELLFDHVMKIEGAGWKVANQSALICNPTLAAFFRDYSRRMAVHKALLIFFLRLGDVRVATTLAVIHSNSLWILKIGFDESLRKLSPGLFLTMETIRYASDEGLTFYEFLGSEESWQHIWNVFPAKNKTQIFIPWSLRSLMLFPSIPFFKLVNKFQQPLSRVIF